MNRFISSIALAGILATAAPAIASAHDNDGWRSHRQHRTCHIVRTVKWKWGHKFVTTKRVCNWHR